MIGGALVARVGRHLKMSCSHSHSADYLTIISSFEAPDEYVVVNVLAQRSPYHGNFPSGSALATANLNSSIPWYQFVR